MLKALELVGFKSFADKTRFEFPPGITVVVGPNGSGKSNIVDGIRWVTGEQSVKSLRGREMADVIFNGSGNRRAVNAAEITLTLDNSAGHLSADTPEVHITRRVYRSGEGEYLINRQPCRLRDIRDLLSGTGMGTEAYCIIEQGKVDVLLQASPKDRRVIFEEAAGISRFKARKVEALRRLERVEQNLLRLSSMKSTIGCGASAPRRERPAAIRNIPTACRIFARRSVWSTGGGGPPPWGRWRTSAANWPTSATPRWPWRKRPMHACWKSTGTATRSTKSSAARNRKSPPIASGSPPRSRRSTTSGADRAISKKRSHARANSSSR
jgi:energy-coupling factor transporter ATP-binding protein EcfA2